MNKSTFVFNKCQVPGAPSHKYWMEMHLPCPSGCGHLKGWYGWQLSPSTCLKTKLLMATILSMIASHYKLIFINFSSQSCSKVLRYWLKLLIFSESCARMYHYANTYPVQKYKLSQKPCTYVELFVLHDTNVAKFAGWLDGESKSLVYYLHVWFSACRKASEDR